MTLRPSVARTLALILPVAALFAVAGCSNKPIPPCPNVRVDSVTGALTKFKDGPGRDVTDVEYEAEITGYNGQCTHHEDEVDVTLDVDLAIIGGPAAKDGKVTLYYFVAVPQFFPQPVGKRIMEISVNVPATNTSTRHRESGVRVTIPLKKDQPAAAFDIYVGFQLDNAQLEHNRSRLQK
jgi:hypothetical protein